MAIKYLNKKLHTTVQLDHLSLKIPSSIEMDKLYLADQANDTLLYSGHLFVKIDMLGLLSGNVHIDSIRLDDFSATITRTLPDTAFNFDYILKAFGSGKEDTPPDTSSSGSFFLGALHLSHIRLHYNDVVTGYEGSAVLGNFITRFKEFDLDSMRFILDSMDLANVYADFTHTRPLVQATPDVPEESSADTRMPDLDFKSLVLQKLDLHYNDLVSEMKAAIRLDTFQLLPDHIDLNRQDIRLKKLALNHSDIVFSMKSKQEQGHIADTASVLSDTASSQPWHIALDQLQLVQDHFRYDDNGRPAQPEGIDYNHVDISDFILLTSDILYSDDSSHAGIHRLSFREQSGFNLQDLTADAVYTSHGATLKDLLLKTTHSRISKYLSISYPSLDSLSADPGNMGMKMDIDSGLIDLKDVFYFVPDLASNEYLSRLAHDPLELRGLVTGKLRDLVIDSLWLKAANRTTLSLRAHLVDVLNTDRASFDVGLKNFSTGRRDLRLLLPDSLWPSSLRIPGRLSLSGTYKGSLQTFQTSLELRSSDGNGSVRAQLKNLQDSLHASYHILADLTRIQLGRLLKNDTLYGPVSLTASVEGSGLTTKSMRANLTGRVRQAELQGYNYQNLVLDGSVENEAGHIEARMEDPNLDFRLVSQADLSDSIPAVTMKLDLNRARLYALHFSEDTLQLQGHINADFDRLDIDKPNGTLLLSDWNVKRKMENIHVDSIRLVALSSDTLKEMQLRSPFVTADVSGNYKLSEAGKLATHFKNEYLGTDSTTVVSRDSLSPWDMRLELRLLPSPLWHQLLPSIARFDGAQFKGLITSNPGKIRIGGAFAPFDYNGISVDSIRLGLFSGDGKLNYIMAGHAIRNGSIDVPHVFLRGRLDSSAVVLNLKTLDQAKKERYHLVGKLNMKGAQYRFSLLHDSLLLNYDSWQIPRDNYVLYTPEGMTVHHLKLQNGGQYVLINSDSTALQNNPLNVVFHDFRLSTLTQMVLADSLEIQGVINGSAKVDSVTTNPLFVTDLRLDSLSMNDRRVGSVLLKVDNKLKDTYSVNMQLAGNGNDVNVTGAYYTSGDGRFDFDVNMASLPLATLEAFSFGQIRDAKGKLTGNLNLKGTTDAPQVNGTLTFNNAGLNITKINNYFTLPDESIEFNQTGIHFNDFTLLDSAKNKAIIDGDILTERYDHFRFNLSLNADNYRILNVPKSQGEPYYGQLYISTDTKIRGDENLPKVDMNIALEKKSDLTIVMQDENPQVESYSGIVEFIDPNAKVDSSEVVTSDSARYSTTLEGIQISANIAIDTSAVLNLVIDPVNGDNLRVRGQANLNFSMDPSGKMSLTGRYSIISGSYNLSLQGLIKREFDILRGSYITWTGDPTSANLDITAQYEVKAPALDLVQDQLTDVSETTWNTYKQQLPFDVYLNLQGELMHPDIHFELGMPQEAQQAFGGAVYTRIKQINTQPSEVNKQTLGLLVLGHFISENPFQTANSGGAEQMVRQSASKILSQQLNRLAGDLIKGVDINFDLQSSQDYSSGTAENTTNLNVGLSKSLFNDRTTVYVGSNIPLEGGNKEQASQIVGDVAVEYKLSRDGRYRLRAYRKNKYQGVIEGQFIETGLSFIIVMDYNKFKELFKKASELSDEE